jgi:hypothetical protein
MDLRLRHLSHREPRASSRSVAAATSVAGDLATSCEKAATNRDVGSPTAAIRWAVPTMSSATPRPAAVNHCQRRHLLRRQPVQRRRRRRECARTMNRSAASRMKTVAPQNASVARSKRSAAAARCTTTTMAGAHRASDWRTAQISLTARTHCTARSCRAARFSLAATTRRVCVNDPKPASTRKYRFLLGASRFGGVP